MGRGSEAGQAGPSHPQLLGWVLARVLSWGTGDPQLSPGGDGSTGGHCGVRLPFTSWADGPDGGMFNRAVT